MRFTDLFNWKIHRIINSYMAVIILFYTIKPSVPERSVRCSEFFEKTSSFHLSGISSNIANATGKYSWMSEGIGSGPDERKKMDSDHECAARCATLPMLD